MKKHILHILFFLLPLVPFGYYLNGEINSPYTGHSYINPIQYLFTWFSENGGTVNYYFIPYDIFIRLLMYIMPEHLAVLFSYALLVVLALVSSYALMNYLFKGHWIAYLGAFLYTYSIYGQYISAVTPHSGAVMFAMFPFIFLIFLRYDGSFFFFDLARLTLTFVLFVNLNLTFIALLYAFLCLLVIYRIHFEKLTQWKSLLFLYISSLCLYILVCLPFFTVFISNVLSSKTILIESLSAESVDWKSLYASPSELFKQTGALNFYYDYKEIIGHPNLNFIAENKFIAFASYILTLCGFMYILVRDSEKKWRRFAFFLIAAYSLFFFMALGTNPAAVTLPLYTFLGKSIPLFGIFRDTYKSMFILNAIQALLVTRTTYLLYRQFSQYGYIALAVVVMCLTVVSYSTWSGKMYTYERIFIPNHWKDIAEYYQEDPANTILLPYQPFTVYSFTSYKGKYTSFYRAYLQNHAISNNDFLQQGYRNENYEALLGLFNIQRILLQYDIDRDYYKTTQPEKIAPYVESTTVRYFDN